MAVNEFKNESPALVAVFDDRNEAELAADDLREAGFRDDQIGFAIRGGDAVQGGMITDAEGVKDAKGAIEGAAAGAVLGAGVGAAVTLLIPGVGPVLAAGVLSTALGYGAAGAAIGGIYGAMRGLGISEEEAQKYDQQFRAGKAIVAVKAGSRIADAAAIFRRHGGFDIHQEPNNPVPFTGPANP
jgi:hypothetical protein